MSDHPSIIDEKKEIEEHKNSDNDTDNQSEPILELDDLHREDSSVTDSDVEDDTMTYCREITKETIMISPNRPEEKTSRDMRTDYTTEEELIPLEKVLVLLYRKVWFCCIGRIY